MKFCPNCGKQIDDDAVMCLNCCYVIPSGNTSMQNDTQKPTEEVKASTGNDTQKPTEEVKASTGLVILSVFIPLVGIILGIIKWKETPKAAKTYLTAGLIAWAVSFLLTTIINLF